MRSGIRGLVAVVIGSAAIGGVLAAPASAARPTFHVTGACTSEEGGVVVIESSGLAGVVQREVISTMNANCVPGKREITVRRA